MLARLDLADVVQQFGKDFLKKYADTPLSHRKVLQNILQCRTSSLGGHEEACNCCGEIRYSYNSCRDRHCPKCQISKQVVWVERLKEATLPIKHFHVIFTVPHELNAICVYDKVLYYKVLFSAVWRTLHSFGYTHYGVETGAVCILHSWGQNLSLHPHIHCIVPSTGYSLKGDWKRIGIDSKFLYSVYELSDTFKGKFLDSLKRKLKKLDLLNGFDPLLQKAWNKKWVVYCEPSMAGAEHVMRYLGQYTHRVAITNQRILEISQTHVTFIAKDYKDNAIKKPVRMKGVEFLRRFCMHILPNRFVKIRRYGIYNHTTKRNLELQFVPDKKPDILNAQIKIIPETNQECFKRITGFDSTLCPNCKKGVMLRIREIPRIRSPDNYKHFLKIRLKL